MSDTFGAAFIDVSADYSPFLQQIEELKRIIATQSATLPVHTGPVTGTPGGAPAPAAEDPEAELRRAIAEADAASARARTVAEDEASRAISRALRDELAAARAARQGEDELAAAARRAAAAAEEEAAAVDRATASNDRHGGSSRNLRLALLGLGLAFLVVEASAVAMGAAIAAAGIKSEESIRTLRLSITDTGQSIEQANQQVAALQRLAAQGLSFTGLIADNKALEDLNLTAGDSVTILTALGNIGAGEGLVGTGLQTFVDGATKAIANVTQSKTVTASSLKDITSALGISQEQLRKELGLTSKQLDDLVTKGKLSSAAITKAAVEAAAKQPNTAGGLTSATNTSVIQAADAIKEQLGTAIGKAFDNPQIAQSITGVAGKLQDAVAKVAPEIQKDALAVVDFLGSAIGPVSDFLAKTLRGLGSFFSDATTEGTALNNFFDTLRQDISDIGVIAIPVFKGIGDALGAIVFALKPLLDGLAFIARNPIGGVLLEGLAAAVALNAALKFTGVADAIILIQDALTAAAAEEGAVAAGAGAMGAALDFALGPFGLLIAAGGLLAYALGSDSSASSDLTSKFTDLSINAQSTSGFLLEAAHSANVFAAAAANAQIAANAQAASQAAFSANGVQGPVEKGAVGATGQSQASLDAASLQKLQDSLKGLNNGSLSGGNSAAKSAATALAQATATFKTALSGFVTAIGGSQTVAAVDSAFKSLQSAIDAEDKALGKKEPTGLVTLLAKQKAALDKSAAEIELGLKERASFLAQADISQVNTSIAGSAGILHDLQHTLDNSKEFSADLKKLQQEGLNQTAIQQLLAVGPTDAGLQAAANLVAAGQAAITGIGGVNDLQTQIAKQGEGLGTTLGSKFQDAGAQAAKGLIDGIQSGIPAMEKAMSKVAASLVAQIKKDLKISSPSRVMFEHGQNVIAGFNLGLAAPVAAVPAPTVGQAGKLGSDARYGTAMTNTFHISVNGDLRDPQGTAAKIGHGIADVLMAQRLSAALAG